MILANPKIATLSVPYGASGAGSFFGGILRPCPRPAHARDSDPSRPVRPSSG